MPILALDVDGVLLDPDRGGDGHWTNEFQRRFGIPRAALREHFFTTAWDDVVNGRRPIEPALGDALAKIGTDTSVEDVLECWFDADFVPVAATLDLARRAAASDVRVVLATNQEHRRASYLAERLGGLIPLDDVVYSAALGVQKHSPEFFALASDRLGVSDSLADVAFVDDVEANVEQARVAGWRAVHATPDGDWIARVDELLGLGGRR